MQQSAAQRKQSSYEQIAASYDQVAAGYDDRWSVHLRDPQQRLTQTLKLAAGMRCADLGCGTGVDTIDMAALTAPEKVVAVDCSQGMLAEARRRAWTHGCALDTVCMDAASFIREAQAASFDVVTMRFCLAYLSFRDVVPSLARMLRSGGRLGILTNVGTSAPQAYAVYRSMIADLGVADVPMPVPLSAEDLNEELDAAGLRTDASFTHSFRLWFSSGSDVSQWLADSGFVTHPALSAAPAEVRTTFWDAFAARIEVYREARGIPLDFEVAGLVATRA